MTYYTVSTKAVCVLADIPPIETVVDEHKDVYSSTHWTSLGSGKALPVRCDERQVTFCKWEERLSGSWKGGWTYLLIQNFKMWFEKGYG